MPITLTLLSIFAVTIVMGILADIVGMFLAIYYKNKDKKNISKFFFISMLIGEFLIRISFSLFYFMIIVAIIEFCVRYL